MRKPRKASALGMKLEDGQKHQTTVQVRLYGEKALTIDHWNYFVNVVRRKEPRTVAPEAVNALTPAH